MAYFTNLCNIIEEHKNNVGRALKEPGAGVRFLMAATIQKHSNFTLQEILCQPYKRSYRQALVKFLCGDLMIGRITKHWYCKDKRVPGMSAGCIDCFKEKNVKVIES